MQTTQGCDARRDELARSGAWKEPGQARAFFPVGRKTQIAGLDNAIQPDAAPPEAREKGRKIRIIAAIRPK
jgi:hypothetical protein